MKFTLSWLKEHLDTKYNDSKIIEKLTDIGLEVESFENVSSELDSFKVARMAEEISDIGDVNVWCVEDAINSVANGALKLASEMPDDMYTAIN